MKKYKLLMMLLVVTIILSGCSLPWQKDKEDSSVNTDIQSPEEEENAHQVVSTGSDTLIIGMNTPKTLNPLYNTQKNVEQALYLIFSPLINVAEDGSIQSNLAESWTVNEAQTVVTVTLRQGLMWHDGTSLTSDDVLFTLEQIQKIPDCPYKQATQNIASMQKIDESTFKIIYKQSFSGVLQTLFFPVIPKHIYDVENSGELSITPIGSGPYCYDHTVPLEYIVLTANEHYFAGKPKIKHIQINYIPDEASSLSAFKQGLIDVVFTNQTEWGKYTNNTANSAYEMVSSNYEFIGLNMNRAIFKEPAIRNALVYGLDREKLIRLYYLDHAIVTDTPVSPISHLYDKTLEIKSYDKEKARLLLAQQGYQEDPQNHLMMKLGQPLGFTLLVNQESGIRVKVAKEIQNMYQELGIEIKLDIVDEATYLERITTKNYDAFLGAYQLSYAMDLSFALHSASALGGENYTSYKDDKMDTLLKQAFVANQKTINNSYAELQKYFSEKSPYVSLFFKKSVLMTKNNIGGPIKPTPLNVFANIEAWTIA